MVIIDWLLKKSPVFQSLNKEFKDHKSNTKNSFKKVKRDNFLLAKRIINQEKIIHRLELKLKNSEPIKIYKPKRKRHKS